MSTVPKVSQVAMRNIIGSVNIHNRIVEEQECWRQREKELEEGRDYKKNKFDRTRPFLRRDRNDIRETSSKYHAHMDSDDDGKISHLIRLYDKVESTCPERWGHSGYKELYPDQFESTDDETENKINGVPAADDGANKSKKKKKHKSRKRKLSSQEDYSEDSGPDEKDKRGHKRLRSSLSIEEECSGKHRRDKTKKRKLSLSASSTTSSSPAAKSKKKKKKSKKKKNKKKSSRT